MGLSIPQYFNEYTVVKGYGPVHTEARWVHNFSVLSLAWYIASIVFQDQSKEFSSLVVWVIIKCLYCFCSSTIWSTCPSHRKHLLLACWPFSLTSHCTGKTIKPGKIEACIGGIGSGHSKQTQEARNSIRCPSIWTSFSHPFDLWGM